MFLTNYLTHRIDRDIITYSVGVSRIDAEVEDFIKKNIRKNLKKSKKYTFKKDVENNMFKDFGTEILKTNDYNCTKEMSKILTAEVSSMIEEDVADVIFAKFEDKNITGFAMLIMEHSKQMCSSAEVNDAGVEVILRMNENILKSRGMCKKAAFIYSYSNDEEPILQILDTDVEKNKIAADKSKFITDFIKADELKDDLYMSKIFKLETEKFVNEIEKLDLDKKAEVLLGLTYDANNIEDFSVREFASIYIPVDIRNEYLDYILEEKGIKNDFKLITKGRKERKLKTRGVDLSINADILNDSSKIKVIKNGDKYDIVLKNIEYLY